MKEHPILFSAPMIRELLAGTKSQTRRLIKPQPPANVTEMLTYHHPKDETHACFWGWGDEGGRMAIIEHSDRVCPYGKVGDRLWVRETWGETPNGNGIVYFADKLLMPKQKDPEIRALFARPCTTRELPNKWRPSIHIPRWASRITLELTEVRVERLQDISEADARAEGAPPSHPSIDRVSRSFGYPDFSRSWYGQLWEKINGPGSWAANPWVWVIGFSRVTP